MYISTSSTVINSCCYILMVLFIASTCSYVIESNNLRNNLNIRQSGMNIPTYYDRVLRATKFPRIGRSSSDVVIPSTDDINNIIEENEDNSNANDFRWMEKRSVLFPRIGKRAFHNLLWANILSNPYRMIDEQGRHHINDYNYQNHPNQPPAMLHYRSK